MSEYALDTRDQPPTTLGDVIYGRGRCASSVPEEEWVRLVGAIARGDQRALRALYVRTHRLVFTLAVRLVSDRESAEEVTLDVFRDVWLRAAEYDPAGGSVVGWIMNQARSRAIDRCRYEQRKKRRPPQQSQEEAQAIDDPDDAMELRRRRDSLLRALALLTSDERRTVETAFFSELTYSETAARLNAPLGTVKTRVRSALAKLRKALASEGEQP